MLDRIEPTRFQRLLLAIPEGINICCAGGRGGGKTFGILLRILAHVDKYGPRARVLIVRRRLKSLIQLAIQLRRLLRNAYGRNVSWNGQDSLFTTPSGATIQLGHCENAAALSDLVQGMEFSLIFVDEAGEDPPIEVIDEMTLSLRAPGIGNAHSLILAANPGSRNHQVIAQRYVAGRGNFQLYEFGGKQWITCLSTLDMNEHLPPGYSANFEVLKETDRARYNAMRYGVWSALVGSYFASAWREEAIVVDYRLLHPDMFSNLRLAIDHGSAAPTVALLLGKIAEDVRLPDDRLVRRGALVVYDERAFHDSTNLARGANLSPSEMAPAIKAMCKAAGVPPHGVIDSATFARQAGYQTATVADLYRKAGIKVRPAKKGPRVPRLETLKQMMVERMLFVTDRCRYFLNTVPSLPRDERNPEDVDTRSVDHALDALSYGQACVAPGVQMTDGFHARRPSINT